MSYQAVKKALETGADPDMLCATCPWDRYCITPPTMTSSEVDKAIDEARAKDSAEAEKAKAEGRDTAFPAGMLITTLAFAGRDSSAQLCPVFAVRLRSSDGRHLVDSIKQNMQSRPSGAAS